MRPVVLCVLLAVATMGAGPAKARMQSEAAAAPPALTLQGEAALWTVAVKPDKVADFERVLGRLRSALTASQKPERRQQAAGWKVVKIEKPLPDGNVAYVHVINPVVPGADYSVMQVLYDEFPNERQELYEAYRGAFAQNLALSGGAVVLDMTRP